MTFHSVPQSTVFTGFPPSLSPSLACPLGTGTALSSWAGAQSPHTARHTVGTQSANKCLSFWPLCSSCFCLLKRLPWVLESEAEPNYSASRKSTKDKRIIILGAWLLVDFLRARQKKKKNVLMEQWCLWMARFCCFVPRKGTESMRHEQRRRC